MKLKSIRWRLTLSYAAIALLAASALGLVLRTILRDYYNRQEASYLQSRAIEISMIASQLFEAGVPAQLIEDQSKSWSFFLQARIQIEDAHRKVIADSGIPNGQNIAFIRSASPMQTSIAGSSFQAPVTGSVPNQTFQIQILQNDIPGGVVAGNDVIVFNRESVGVAMPMDVTMNGLLDSTVDVPARRSTQVEEQQIKDKNGLVVGRVILSDGPAYGDEILNNVMNGWIVASIAAVLLAALAGWLVSNRITTPLTALTHITSRMSQGDLSARADIHSEDEIGTLSHSFNEMAERVEETVGTLRSFVADAAHELHTPLTALQANIELARDEKNVSARTRYLRRAQEQGARLEALVKSLLDLSRIEAADADAKSNFVSVDLLQLVREVGEQFASRAEQTDRSFMLNIPEAVVTVLGNETQLRQVVSNLLENALKFTPVGGTISLNVERAADEITLTVSDTGIGIPAEDLPHLFERFHRGRNVAEFTGNGLGLAIVKAITQSHLGRVEAQSDGLGNGSRFVVSLPAA